MRKSIIVLIILGLSILAQMQSPMAEEINKMEFPEIEWQLPVVGEDIMRYELPSGVVLFLKENHSIPLVEINIYIRGGSYYMDKGEKSISKLFARMIERGGTEKFTPAEFTEKMEINAIKFNIWENGFYYSVNMLTGSSVLDTSLVLLEEALFHPRFDSEIMKIEGRRLKESWKKMLDNPNDVMGHISNYTLYKGHPAGAIPDFTLIDEIDENELLEVRERFIQPENMIIGIVGDFNTDEMKEKIESIFSNNYNTDRKLGQIPELTGEVESRVFFKHMDTPQGCFNIQHRGRKAPFNDIYDVSVMNYILGGGGFTSRIVLKVRNEKGLAYRTRSYYETMYPLCGRFHAYSATRSEAAHEASRYILEEISRIRNEKVSELEHHTAKESYINSIVTRLGDDWHYIPRLMVLELQGVGLDYYTNMRDRIESISREDILNAAEQYLHPDRLHVILVGDREEIDLESFEKQFGEIEEIEYNIPGI